MSATSVRGQHRKDWRFGLRQFESWVFVCAAPQARTKEKEGLQQSVEELQAQVLSMEGTKGWFERRLKEAEVMQETTYIHFH